MASHRCEAVPAPSQSESGLCQVQAYRCHVHVRMMRNSTWQPTALIYIVYYVRTVYIVIGYHAYMCIMLSSIFTEQ